jgi:hypothetical protein
MTNLLIRRNIALALALAIPVVFLSGFSGNYQWTLNNITKASQIAGCDTVPAKSKKVFVEKNDLLNMPTEAVESALREVEKSMIRLKNELRSLDWNKPLNDFSKNMDDLNWKLINETSQRALMEAQMQLNVVKLKSRLFNEDNFRLPDVKRNIILSKVAFENNKRDMQLAMNIARDGSFKKININLLRLKEGWQDIKDFKNDLEKDGFIKKGEPYIIEIKQGTMYIDGRKQSNRVNKRYKAKYPSYFGEGENFKLQNDGKEPAFKEGELI